MTAIEASQRHEESLDLTIPYWFSAMARHRQENLQISDYVRVRGLDKQFELVDVFPRFGSCRVRAVGETSCLLIPWAHVSPWKDRRTSSSTRAIGDWLFGKNRVYLLSEPDRMLKQRRIHWDKQTCDLEDEDGNVLRDVPWERIEFWDPVEYHFPDDA